MINSKVFSLGVLHLRSSFKEQAFHKSKRAFFINACSDGSNPDTWQRLRNPVASICSGRKIVARSVEVTRRSECFRMVYELVLPGLGSLLQGFKVHYAAFMKIAKQFLIFWEMLFSAKMNFPLGRALHQLLHHRSTIQETNPQGLCVQKWEWCRDYAWCC